MNLKKESENLFDNTITIRPVQNYSKDRNHLQFIYDRMFHVHNKEKDVDYMLKFKEIINNTK